MAFVSKWSQASSLGILLLLTWIGLSSSKFYQWKGRQGQPNCHNGKIPKSHWLRDWETQAIIAFHHENSTQGYRRLTYMMMDREIVAVSPSTTYNVLKKHGLMGSRFKKSSKKGTGFEQPLKPHEHWHTDITYLNIAGTFYYLCAVLDGFSRKLLHFEIRESMKTADVELVLQRALEKYPGTNPRIISDNGPQYVSRDFKDFVRESGMSHVRTSPYYPQSNGKIERLNGSLKMECIRPEAPDSLEAAIIMVAEWVRIYNDERLHSGIDYITPSDKLAGHAHAILAKRDMLMAIARQERAAAYAMEPSKRVA